MKENMHAQNLAFNGKQIIYFNLTFCLALLPSPSSSKDGDGRTFDTPEGAEISSAMDSNYEGASLANKINGSTMGSKEVS